MTLILLAGLLTCSCGEETEEEIAPIVRVEWSDMSATDRATVYRAFGPFLPAAVTDPGVLQVVDIIADAAAAGFAAGYAGGPIVVTNAAIELTSPQVLPELDIDGALDPRGGYIPFTETIQGDFGVSSSDVVHKRYRHFTAGAVTGLTYENTIDSPSDGLVSTGHQKTFDVSADTEYIETAWHQSRSFVVTDGETHDEAYDYQSHPVWTFTVTKDSTATTTGHGTDQVLASGGWDTSEAAALEGDLSGTLTRYCPKITNVEPNTKAAHAPEVSKIEDGGLKVVRTTETTVLLEGGVSTTTTQGVETRTDVATGRITQRTAFVHSTIDYGETLETTRDVTQSLYTYPDDGDPLPDPPEDDPPAEDPPPEDPPAEDPPADDPPVGEPEGSYERTDTVFSYRYTDDPRTRNDVVRWMSTKTTTTTTVDADKGSKSVATSGTIWLTDQLKADPQFDAAPFSFVGRLSNSGSTHARYLDPLGGIDSWATATFDVDAEVTFGEDQAGATGSYTNRATYISAADGNAHSVIGDGDGSITVTVGGADFLVAAEEWLRTLQSEAPLADWLAAP